MKRACGVLLPVTSLPSKYGIGCFSKEAYEFVDFLSAAGQTYWQILPLGQTGYGDSPYQSFSTFAGNPYLIDPEKFIELGYITKGDADACDFGGSERYIDYEKMYFARYPLLQKAYANSPYALQPEGKWADSAYDGERAAFEKYIKESPWLEDYALFCAVKDSFGGVGYENWDEDIRLRQPEAMAACKEKLENEIRFVQFQQYMFITAWTALKDYANGKGIKIIGDIPIYVAMDSSDTWSHPELFEFDEKGFPTVVAGCPPDAFSETGQLWGNPIYKWAYHKETGYVWWMERLKHVFELYDVVRIDHFRGFDEYWAIPYGDETAVGGEWRPGPGYELFQTVRDTLGEKAIIAEDLGFLTPTVLELVKKTGYPGMKVLQFAFDGSDNAYLPHNYKRNCIVYTGTHDNDTTRGWYDSIDRKTKKNCREYVGITSPKKATAQIIRAAFMSVADTAIVPMQDYLDLGSEARINTPSTLGLNWKWRLLPSECTSALADEMLKLATVYRRKSAGKKKIAERS